MNISVPGLEDDDVVWRRDASYVDGNGQVHFTIRTMTRDVERKLLELFGRDWLNAYLADVERELERFRMKGVH